MPIASGRKDHCDVCWVLCTGYAYKSVKHATDGTRNRQRYSGLDVHATDLAAVAMKMLRLNRAKDGHCPLPPIHKAAEGRR
jgi:hypothetical protein